jgi:hypothetical protein
MRIAKPLLSITTPVGVIGGLREAYRFSPGVAFLMFALVSMITVAAVMVVSTVRAERAANGGQR